MRTYSRFLSLSFPRFFKWFGLAAVLIILLINGAPPARARGGSQVHVGGQGKVRVIVTLNVPTQPEGKLKNASDVAKQRANIKAEQDALLKELPAQSAATTVRLTTVPVLGLEVNEAALNHLVNSPRVAHVGPDVQVYPSLASSTAVIDADLAWAMGYEGTGRTVAILDSGVEASHPFFGGRVVHEACFSTTNEADATTSLCPNGQHTQTGPGSADPSTCADAEGCEHGTYTAGIAAGSGTDYDGVARNANIVAIQVMSKVNAYPQCIWMIFGIKCVAGYESDLLEALEYLHTNKATSFPTLDAINISLGGGLYSSECDAQFPEFKDIIDNLKSVGVATVIASGNDYSTGSIAFPGCISSAVTVGATDDDDNVADFSNSASWLDLWAPGVDIESSVTGGGFTPPPGENGTSAATPFVTGAFAVYRQAHPGDSVDQMLAAFQETGVQIPLPGDPSVTVARIDVDNAITGPCFTLTTGANPALGGSVTVNTPQNCIGGFTPGTVVSITAVSNTGYTFSNWSGDTTDTNATTTLTMTSNKTATANFSENCYMLNTITSPVAGGSVALGTAQNCSGGYKHGTVVSITASPNPGYGFGSWSGDSTDANAATNVTMDGNKQVTANFTLNCYTLSTNADPVEGGSVMVNTAQNCPGGFSYGTIVLLTALPAPDASFTGWSGDASGTDTTTTVMIDGNKSVTGSFEGGSPPPTPTDLLTNGGFEVNANGDLVPDNWTPAKLASIDGQDCTVFYSGICSMKFRGSSANATKTLTQIVSVSGSIGDTFSLSGWGKTTSIPSGAVFRIQVVFFKGTTQTEVFTLNFNKGTHGWQQMLLAFPTTKAYDKVRVVITLKATGGTAWFDDVSLVKN